MVYDEVEENFKNLPEFYIFGKNWNAGCQRIKIAG
jgi:hypothetical protein